MPEVNIRSITGLPESLPTLDILTRQTIKQAMALAGYTLVAGSVEAGATLTSSTNVVLLEATLQTYYWVGAFPITITDGNALTTYGVIGTNWIEVTNALPDLSTYKAISDFSKTLLLGVDSDAWLEALGIPESLNQKAPLASPIFTGQPETPTATKGDSSTQIANTLFVMTALHAAITGLGFTNSDLTALAESIVNKANLDSPTFIGLPKAPTADLGTSSKQLATTEFIAQALAALRDSAPSTLNTLKALATAVGNDPDFSGTMTENLALKSPIASPVFTGVPKAPTPDAGNNSEQIATTEFVTKAIGEKNIVVNPDIEINLQTGVSYTLQLTDHGKVVEMGNSNANTVIIPNYSKVAFDIGANVLIRQMGKGVTTIVADSGVTIRNPHDTLNIKKQFGAVAIHQRSANVWCIAGGLADE